MTEIECSGKTTTKSEPLLIVVRCVEMAAGVAKLLAAVIESPLIVSITALEATCAPPTCMAVRKDLSGSVLTTWMKMCCLSALRLVTTSK
jgi:hypothetical protein